MGFLAFLRRQQQERKHLALIQSTATAMVARTAIATMPSASWKKATIFSRTAYTVRRSTLAAGKGTPDARMAAHLASIDLSPSAAIKSHIGFQPSVALNLRSLRPLDATHASASAFHLL